MLIAFYMGKRKKCFNSCKAGLCPSWAGYCRRYICKTCEKPIERGEEAIRLLLPSNGFYRPKAFTFHRTCYINQFNFWLDSQYAEHPPKVDKRVKTSKEPKKAWGRPKKWENPVQVNKLKTLLSYHRRMGHQEVVSELERQLGEVCHVQQLSGTAV